jgi:hypothetical protein
MILCDHPFQGRLCEERRSRRRIPLVLTHFHSWPGRGKSPSHGCSRFQNVSSVHLTVPCVPPPCYLHTIYTVWRYLLIHGYGTVINIIGIISRGLNIGPKTLFLLPRYIQMLTFTHSALLMPLLLNLLHLFYPITFNLLFVSFCSYSFQIFIVFLFHLFIFFNLMTLVSGFGSIFLIYVHMYTPVSYSKNIYVLLLPY